MKSAYDLADLGQRLKDSGLPIAMDALESAAAKVYVSVKEWAKESAVLSENKIDDFAAPFYDQLDQIVMPAIDKINGRPG